MMWVLVICPAFWLGLCSSYIKTATFNSFDECQQARTQIIDTSKPPPALVFCSNTWPMLAKNQEPKP